MTAPKDQAVIETSIGALLDDGDFHELYWGCGHARKYATVLARKRGG